MKATPDFTATQAEVMAITAITPGHYAQHQWDCAFRFLELQDCDEAIQAQFTNTSVFWSWWRLQWHYREEMFLAAYHQRSHKSSPDAMARVWYKMHSPERLVSKPPVELIQRSYAKLVGQIIKEVTQPIKQTS